MGLGDRGPGAEGGAEALRNGGGRSNTHTFSEPEIEGSALGRPLQCGRFSLTLPGFLLSSGPLSWPPGRRRSGVMASEACLSVPLAMPSYAWRKGLRTPRTGGKWWEHVKAPGRERKRAGPDLPHLLCFAEWCSRHNASAQPPVPLTSPQLSLV